ncbi:hypothetical protein [Paenibacillus sp. JCM 10914]|uniref:hypothetical protein n=1 Tax=Paenibacillus sp. JCM 10914 TaxID=1236974 RepID=UPI0003CC7D60|nr:hypothetical protein [Paenibacillus sp. JCM 10914]GAE06300.1 hypothetical protein JCM10914_2450 [Paenibacillus sp. JCM 10914]
MAEAICEIFIFFASGMDFSGDAKHVQALRKPLYANYLVDMTSSYSFLSTIILTKPGFPFVEPRCRLT